LSAVTPWAALFTSCLSLPLSWLWLILFKAGPSFKPLANLREGLVQKKTMLAGLLITLSLSAFSYQTLSYKDQDLNLTAQKSEKVPVPRMVGILTFSSAVLLLVRGPKSSLEAR